MYGGLVLSALDGKMYAIGGKISGKIFRKRLTGNLEYVRMFSKFIVAMKKRSICGGLSENRWLVRNGRTTQGRALWSSRNHERVGG